MDKPQEAFAEGKICVFRVFCERKNLKRHLPKANFCGFCEREKCLLERRTALFAALLEMILMHERYEFIRLFL